MAYTFPVIDVPATGRNIEKMRKDRGLSVRDLQNYFGFEEPQAIYKWQWGRSLPSVDNLYALGALFGVSMEEILVAKSNIVALGQQEETCCPGSFLFYGKTNRNALNPWFKTEKDSRRTIVQRLVHFILRLPGPVRPGLPSGFRG